MSLIHVTVPGGTAQQLEEEDATQRWRTGGLPEGTLCWKEGMSDWQPATEFFGADNPTVHLRAYTKDPKGLTQFVLVMFWIFLGMEMVSILSDIGTLMLLGSDFTEAEAEADDLRSALVGGLYAILYLVTAIAFLKWVYRAALNAVGFGAKGMSSTPGWSVGWFFVPIMTLFKPYEAVTEIWQTSLHPRKWRTQPIPNVFKCWWGLWLISNLLGQIIMRFPAESIEELEGITLLSIFSSLLGIPLCLVVIKMIRMISGNQENGSMEPAWILRSDRE